MLKDVFVLTEMRTKHDKSVKGVGFQQIGPFGEFVFEKRFAKRWIIVEFNDMEMRQNTFDDFLRGRRRVLEVAGMQLQGESDPFRIRHVANVPSAFPFF